MFQEHLSHFVARAGARWAVIAGSDGILLETHSQDFRTEAEALAAEFAVWLRAGRKAAGNTEMGTLLQTSLATERGRLLLQTVNDDYFLAALLNEDSYAGKACFELSQLAKSLHKELSF